MLNNTKIKFERILKEIYQFDNLKTRVILKSFCTYLLYYYLKNYHLKRYIQDKYIINQHAGFLILIIK